MNDSGPWKSLVSQKLRDRDAREQIPFVTVFDAYHTLLNSPQIVLDGVVVPDFIEASKHGTTEELLFAYRKMSETQRALRKVELENVALKTRLEAVQRMVPDSKEYAEELMHAYRKMGLAQDAEYAMQRQLKASEKANVTLKDSNEALQHQVDELKLIVRAKDDALTSAASQLTILRRDMDSMHRTLIRREEEAKLLTAKSNLLAQENDGLTRLRARMEADYASLKSVVKARDTTIAELQRSKAEYQKKLEAARFRSVISASHSTANANSTHSNSGTNTSIADSFFSLIGLPTSKQSTQPIPASSYHAQAATSPSNDPSSADEFSDLALPSYSTDNGEIFKLTDGDTTVSPPPEPEALVGSTGLREVGKASLKLGALNRIEDEPRKSLPPPSVKRATINGPLFSYTKTIYDSQPASIARFPTSSSPSHGPQPPSPGLPSGSSVSHGTLPSMSHSAMNAGSGAEASSPPFTKNASMSSLPTLSASAHSDEMGISPPMSRSESMTSIGTLSSSGENGLVFDAVAEARLLEIQRKLDDTSTSWSGSVKSKSVTQLPTQVKTTVQACQKTNSKQALICACVDPTGMKMLLGGETPLAMYDAASGAVQRSFKAPTKTITSVSFDDKGSLMLASATDNTARIWFPNVSAPCTINHPAEVHMAAFCGTGRIATIARNRSLCIWDVHSASSYKFTYSSPQKSTSYAMCVNPISNLVYTGHMDRLIRIFDSKRGMAISQFDTGHSDYITGLQLSPDGSKIYSTSRDNTICCYDSSNQKLLNTFSHKDLRLESNWARASLSPTGEHIAIGSSCGRIFIWDTESTKLVATLKGSNSAVRGVSWNPASYSNLVSFDDQGVVSIWT
jgi:WD40 repeat protein